MTKRTPYPESQGFDLETTYVQLLDDGAAACIPVDASFWGAIERRTELHAGRLVGLFEMHDSPDHREVHPNGDELLILMSGSLDVVLETREGEQRIPLRGRGACVVPRGVWHGQVVHAPSLLMFITPGAGTQHSPAPVARRPRPGL
jgi:hypothetical protein